MTSGDRRAQPATGVLATIDQINYVPRVTVPTLMVNGSGDYIYPLETSQKPLFAHLGTPAAHKRHLVFPAGHGVLGQQRGQVVKEVLDWLDRYLGPVAK